MCEPASIAAIAMAVSAASGLATTGYQFAQASGGKPSGPDPMVAAKAAQDASDKARLRGVIGGSAMADAQTRTSGGTGPDFLANVATQQAGTPNMQGDALDMVKQLMAGGGS